MNGQMREHILRTMIIHLLIHIRQKKIITLEIAAKTASVKAVFQSSHEAPRSSLRVLASN
jgi:hypothetical protein